MQTLRRWIRSAIICIPPFGRWAAERDRLRNETSKLRIDLEKAESALATAETRIRDLSGEHNGLQLWAPPGHFYSPIPAVEYLKAREEEVFGIPEAIRGVQLNEQEQLQLLEDFRAFYAEQPFTSQKVSGRRYFFDNPNFSYADALTLYAMIRRLRPQRIVEVGSGYSSCVMLDVNELYFDRQIALTFIDPFPQLLKSMLKESDRERVRIIGRNVQDVDVRVFQDLGASDILFIDSSHVSKTGSDVNYLVFKILPLLAQGVFIHVHDVFYPFEYPKDWALEGRSWNEAYLLRAFLQYNDAFRIRFFGTYLMQNHRPLFESDFPLFLKNTGGSLWLEKVRRDAALERPQVSASRATRQAPRAIDLSVAGHVWFLGEGWHEAEAGHCWMESDASVDLAGPDTGGQKLIIRGYSPHSAGARLTVWVDGFEAFAAQMSGPGRVDAEFALPDAVVGRPAITVRLNVDRTWRPPDDPREMGFSLESIAIAQL